MLDINPPARHARAMATSGVMGVTLGPIVGPALGGWLTENYNWPLRFFISTCRSEFWHSSVSWRFFFRERRRSASRVSTSSGLSCVEFGDSFLFKSCSIAVN